MKCPACGFTDETGMKKVTAAMNVYVHSNGQVNGVYNDDAKEITITVKGAAVKLLRKDVYEASKKGPITPEPTKTEPTKA